MVIPVPIATGGGGAVNIHPKLPGGEMMLVEFAPAYQAAPPVAFEFRMLK